MSMHGYRERKWLKTRLHGIGSRLPNGQNVILPGFLSGMPAGNPEGIGSYDEKKEVSIIDWNPDTRDRAGLVDYSHARDG